MAFPHFIFWDTQKSQRLFRGMPELDEEMTHRTNHTSVIPLYITFIVLWWDTICQNVTVIQILYCFFFISNVQVSYSCSSNYRKGGYWAKLELEKLNWNLNWNDKSRDLLNFTAW